MRLFRRGVIPIEGTVAPLSEREVLRAVGVRHHRQLTEIEERGVRDAIALAVRRAMEMTSFKAVFRSSRVMQIGHDEIALADAPPKSLLSAALVEQFSDAKEIAIFAVTFGQLWDDVLDDLGKRGEAAEAWFLDALGNRFVHQASKQVEDRIARHMSRLGLARLGRYRPGYGEVPLDLQRFFCNFVDAARIGVQPNEAMSLWPRKSVTTIVGFGERKTEPDTSSIVNAKQTS